MTKTQRILLIVAMVMNVVLALTNLVQFFFLGGEWNYLFYALANIAIVLGTVVLYMLCGKLMGLVRTLNDHSGQGVRA